MTMTTATAADETKRGERFAFGKNWREYLRTFDEPSRLKAKEAMISLLSRSSLEGLSFLDVGSGSGIHSLVAWQLGARVVSFDFDPECVKCTSVLKDQYAQKDERWSVLQGSALDVSFLNSLGQFDIVYSWGVLHHTGDMWTALANVAELTSKGGSFAIALYNDQGVLSRYWKWEKRHFNRNAAFRMAAIVMHFPTVFLIPLLLATLRGMPTNERGMRRWYNYLDWLGGYPFEVASPEAVFNFFRDRFELVELRTRGGNAGCNEFVFHRRSS